MRNTAGILISNLTEQASYLRQINVSFIVELLRRLLQGPKDDLSLSGSVAQGLGRVASEAAELEKMPAYSSRRQIRWELDGIRSTAVDLPFRASFDFAQIQAYKFVEDRKLRVPDGSRLTLTLCDDQGLQDPLTDSSLSSLHHGDVVRISFTPSE